MRCEMGLLLGIALLWACGGQTFTVPGDAGGDGASSSSSGSSSGGSSGGSGSSSGSSSGGSSGGSSGSSSGGSSGGSSGSSSGGNHEVPVNHRPDDSECLQPAAPGDCQGGSSGGQPGNCGSDSQCTSGTNGRCVEQGGGVLFCACTYDTCADDAACPTDQTCACHGSTYMGGLGNTCVPGNCRVDGDCGAGGYCSPSFSTQSCGSLGGYYCHTPQDQCVNDADCGSGFVCNYSTSAARWTCQQELLCG